MMVNGQYDIRVNDGQTLLHVLVDAPSIGLPHLTLVNPPQMVTCIEEI